jgi:hypothetical protein
MAYHVVYATYRKRHAEAAKARYANAYLWYTPHSGWQVRVPVEF